MWYYQNMGSYKGVNKRVEMGSATEHRNVLSSIKHHPEWKQRFHEYPKIRALRDDDPLNILDGRVVIEEKIHGLNLRLLVLKDGFVLGSRRKSWTWEQIPVGHPLRNCLEIVANSEVLEGLRQKLPVGTIIYGELFGGRHSKRMGYEGIPEQVRFFNILYTDDSWGYTNSLQKLLPEELVVPVLDTLDQPSIHELEPYMLKSQLGDGDKEGIVVKRVDTHNRYDQQLWTKIVRADFNEDKRHRKRLGPKELKQQNLADTLCKDLVNFARIDKAASRVEEKGKLSSTPQDLPLILKALKQDLRAEAGNEINNFKKQGMKEKVFWKTVKTITNEYYRDWLLKNS